MGVWERRSGTDPSLGLAACRTGQKSRPIVAFLDQDASGGAKIVLDGFKPVCVVPVNAVPAECFQEVSESGPGLDVIEVTGSYGGVDFLTLQGESPRPAGGIEPRGRAG